MARQILPIAGAVIGGLATGGASWGIQLGYVAGSLIGNAVDPLEVQGNKIGDNQLQAAAEGGTRAIVFGKGCIRATCLLERGNRIVRKQRDRAGKGSGPVTVNERVYWTFAIGLGEGMVGGAILRIWEGEKLVYDVTPGSAIPEESAEFAQKFRFYDGAEDQLPDPALESIHGVGNAPYYRGTAYVVFPNFDLTDYREAIPTYRWEVAKSVSTTTPTTVMALGSTSATIRRIAVSHDGADWSAPLISNSAEESVNCLALGSRFVAWTLNTAYYSDDDWATSQTASGSFHGSGGARYGAAYGDVVLVPGGTETINRSDDRGESYSQIGALVRGNFIAIKNGLAIIAGYYSAKAFISSDLGVTWSEGAGDTGVDMTTGGAICASLTKFYLGGKSGSAPALKASLDGNAWANVAIPYSADGAVTCIAHGVIGEDSYIVAGTSSGEIYYSINEGAFALAAGSLGVRAQDVVFNGLYFIMCGDDSLGTSVIKTSVDADIWVTRSKLLSYGILALACATPVVGTSVGEPILLSQIARALHERCGHSAHDIEVSELDDLVCGVVFEQSVTGAEAINSIIGGYFADPADYDGRIHYIKRGKPVVRTLTYDDLIDEPESTQRQNPIEYPRKLHLFAQTSWTGYVATKSTSPRSSPDLKNVVGEVSVAIPVTFDGPDEPAQIAAKLHKVNWADAEGEIVWSVTDAHADLVPTDCVGLYLRNRLTRARITGIEDTPGVRKLTMRVDRQSAYTSEVTGMPLPLPTPPQPSILSPTVNAYMDIPALRDSDDAAAPIYYDAMSGQTDVWPGSVLQRSLDTGANFATVAAAPVNAIIGQLQEAVAAASPYYTDNGIAVVVKLYMDDELDSLTNAQFLSEQGAFALSWEDGDVRRWEVMQYRDAEEIADKTYRLTTLHRGRLNTAAAEHPVGSLFVLLDASVRVVDAQSAWIGADLTHRAVTNSLSPETAAQDTQPFAAQSQTEWPVAHILLDHAGNDLHVDIVPRHRFGTALNPIRSINWTGYRITATDGSNTAAVDVTADTHAFDVTGWASPITVTVAQLNRITGAGPTVTEAIP